MKRKELFRRLSAISMAAMMTVTAVPSNIFAADIEFTDSEQETTEADAETAEADVDFADAEEEPQADVEEPEVEDAVQEAEGGAGEADIFSDENETVEEDFQSDATGTATPAADATVHMTISVAGVLAAAKDGTAMAQRDVTVKDLNSDGILTYDEALSAAHDEYYEGGAAAGYASADSQYGLSLTKLWGDTSGYFGYWDNDRSCNNLSDEVKADDYLTAFVYKDQSAWSDSYTRFVQKEYQATVGKAVTVSVEKASYDENYNTVFAAYDAAGLAAYDSEYKPLAVDAYSVDGSNVTFNQAGTYYLATAGTDSVNLVPAVAKVTVEAWKAPFSNIRLYASDMDYTNEQDPIVYTPDYDADVHQYAVTVPDYLSSLYAAVNYADGVKHYSVMYTTSWGKYGSGHSSTIEDNVDTGEAYFPNGYIGVYYQDGSPDAEDRAYHFNVDQYTTLKRLKVDGVIDQKFNKDTRTYHVYVDDTKNSISITPTAYKSNYTVTVNGTKVTSGKAYELAYNWDENGRMEVSIEVSNEGMTSTVYTLNLEKTLREDKPFITAQPQKNTDYIVNASTKELSILASSNGTMTYQWYMNTVDSNEGGTPIEGATEETYKPSSDTAGTFYYYCVVTNTDKTENNTTATDTACVVVDPDPTPEAIITTIGTQLPDDYLYAWKTGYVYKPGDAATPLVVNATSATDGGTFSYKWVYSDNPSFSDGYSSSSKMNVAAERCTPSTELEWANNDGLFYGCRVSYKYKGKTYTSWAKTGKTYTTGEGDSATTQDVLGVYVFVKVDSATTPAISTQPASATYMVGDTTTALTVSASIQENVGLAYQWYVNDTESTENGNLIEGATKSSYKFDASEAGTKYYYCVVTNKIQGYTASTTSEIAKIEIRKKEDLIPEKLKGSGTQEDPYLIKTAEDYQSVAELVAEGIPFKDAYLRQENDITLPAGWKPIGVTKDGSNDIKRGQNLSAFSGILDGNNKTITIPEGGLPLLGYVQNAEVRNLNIYGTKIAGYGLVNNFEGVGLSGNAITIENVTLKSGSSTLKSGFFGANITTNGYAGCSAGFDATLRNCTVEEGVVVGYDKDQTMIGSFAGRMQGTVENCVSYATVYGKDYVGGIIGTRDNAMGNCAVSGCEFNGTVKASGQHAGGIAGGGYENNTAPNGIKITINNCKVGGTVTGADKVGGILGGDTYEVQAWNPYTMKGNSFTGRVQATAENASYIGGIIGFYESLNKFDDISNNYYAKDCGADRGIGFVQYVDTNCTTHETASGATYFSTEKNTDDCPAVSGCNWRAQHNRTDDPLGADAAKLANTDGVKLYAEKLEISGDYRTEFYQGEDLDLKGMTVKAQMSDGTTRDVAVSELTIDGYNKDGHGEQTLTLSYSGASTQIVVKVLKKDAQDIKVNFMLLGDQKHDSDTDKTYHTLHADNLETWIADSEYEVGGNATVLDVVTKVLTENEYTFENAKGNYISSITKADGTKLAEKDNGTNSGWMYTLNGSHPELAVNEQYLEDGDTIVFHYTDDYTKEHDHVWSSEWTFDENAHWHECTYQWSKCDITDNTKKNGYAAHTFDEGKVTKEPTCKEAGEKLYTCTVCGATKTEKIAKTDKHTYDKGVVTKKATYTATGVKTYTCTVCGATKTETIPKLKHTPKYVWKTVSKATVFQPEKQVGYCVYCKHTQTRYHGSKLKATIKLNTTAITLQRKQATKRVRVSMANGDSIRSWVSTNTKIVTVDRNGLIRAQNRNGSAKIIVTLKSGKRATLNVKVQSGKVTTTKISGLKSSMTLKKGQKTTLKPVISPLTSTDKVTYATSNKNIATVSSAGIIVAKKKGTAKITVRSGKKSYVIKVTVK